MARSTGVGGIFFRCEDPKALAVDELDGMVARLAYQGVAVLGREDGDPNGRFAWFVDIAKI